MLVTVDIYVPCYLRSVAIQYVVMWFHVAFPERQRCVSIQDAQRRQDSLHSYPAEDMQPYLKILRMLKKSLKGGIHLSVSYIAEVQMDLGEKIHIKSVVKPVCESDIAFLIRDARFELYDVDGNLEDSGPCRVNDHELDVMVSPKMAGAYRMRYIYDVADETWIDDIKLKVRG